MKTSICMIFLMISTTAIAQLPYAEIPEYPENYSAGTLAARMIDGLGFRFYWVTEGLGSEDLQFSAGTDTRSVIETIDHIYEMSFLLANTVLPEKRQPEPDPSFNDKRQAVLQNLFDMREIVLNSSDDEFKEYNAVFSNGTSYPFWNMVNGPIADCLWHCGQIVMLRRMAGNPFDSKVSLFNGKLREQ